MSTSPMHTPKVHELLQPISDLMDTTKDIQVLNLIVKLFGKLSATNSVAETLHEIVSFLYS